MSWEFFAAGVFVGLVLGIGGTLFYIRWKMLNQIGQIENQMGAMMDISEEMGDMMDPENMDMDLDDFADEKEGDMEKEKTEEKDKE